MTKGTLKRRKRDGADHGKDFPCLGDEPPTEVRSLSPGHVRRFHQLKGRGCYEEGFGLLPLSFFFFCSFGLLHSRRTILNPSPNAGILRDRETVDGLRGYSPICICYHFSATDYHLYNRYEKKKKRSEPLLVI